jgi:hypothetical protein
MVRATVSDASPAHARINAVQGDELLATAVVEHFNGVRHVRHSRALLALGLLGQLRSTTGEQFFMDLLSEPPPAGGPVRAKGGPVREEQHLQYQAKAVHGLAFMRSVTADNELLQSMSAHPAPRIRREAVRAYVFNQPQTVRDGLAARVRPDEQHLLDRFENRNLDGTSYGERLAAYLAKHPELAE